MPNLKNKSVRRKLEKQAEKRRVRFMREKRAAVNRKRERDAMLAKLIGRAEKAADEKSHPKPGDMIGIDGNSIPIESVFVP